jgi:hypothetical protein
MSVIDIIGWSLVIIGAVVASIAIGCVVGESMRIRLPDYDEPPWSAPPPLLALDEIGAKEPTDIGKSHST